MNGPIHVHSALTSVKERPVTIEYKPGCGPETIWTFRRRKNSLSYQKSSHKSSHVHSVCYSLHQERYLGCSCVRLLKNLKIENLVLNTITNNRSQCNTVHTAFQCQYSYHTSVHSYFTIVYFLC